MIIFKAIYVNSSSNNDNDSNDGTIIPLYCKHNDEIMLKSSSIFDKRL